MDNNELINKINEFQEEDTRVSFQIGHKENKNYLFYDTKIDSEVQKDIFKLLKVECLKVIGENELVEFDPVGRKDKTIEKINACDVGGYLQLKENRIDRTNFSEKLDEIGEINFYLLEVQNNDNTLKIFRRYSKSKSLAKGNIFKMLSSKFEKIEENIFQIDNIIDFIVLNDEIIIIFSRYSFEIITNYKDNYMANLEQALREISDSNLINNMEQFKEDCQDSVKIAKQFTKAMQENSIALILDNLENIEEAINEAELPIEFKNNQFQYESKEHLSILVALLSDKYAKTLICNRITNGD